MNTVNLQASVSNLTQVDRLQQDAHRAPIINQEANAAVARQEAERRIDMPVQPDQVDGKNIDPDDRRKQEQEKKKRREKEQRHAQRSPSTDRSTGHFVDLDA